MHSHIPIQLIMPCLHSKPDTAQVSYYIVIFYFVFGLAVGKFGKFTTTAHWWRKNW